jgi:hypothetical protein
MKEAEDLILFLTSDTSYFERSTFSATLEAIKDRAFTSRPCPICKTYGVLDVPWIQTHRRVFDGDGEELEPERLEKPIKHQTGKDCENCKGNGYLPVRIKKNDSNATAKPTINRKEAAKESPPDTVIVRYAKVSRRFSHMSPALAGVLVDCWGDSGEALKDTMGRAWACAPRTVSGHDLLHYLREKSKGKRKVEPWRQLQALIEEANLEKVEKNEKRAKLLAGVLKETIELLNLAEREWEALVDVGM